MSKATRIRQQNAREKIAAQRAAARRAEVRKRVLITAGSVVAVLAIVVAFIAVKAFNKAPSSSTPASAQPASVTKNVTTVPASALNSVGLGSILSYNPSPISSVSGSALTSNGKPEMLYIGAEFCPYCAAERWAMAIALSRFGTFTSPLNYIHSSSTDTDPNTPTLTFYKTTYSSKYLVFTPVENETVSHALLQTPTAAQQTLWNKYNPNAYPFIDFGNKYVIKNPSYDPAVLAGLTWAQVAAALHDPSSKVAQNADGAANLITAAICKMTNGQPGSVCTQSGVVKASGSL
jgi:thiol-disulfide isomerase/thioredoxin